MGLDGAFRQVAEIPEQTVFPRSNRNPYDKSTLVSIFPIEIEDSKPTIQPSRFVIPAGTFNDPAVVTIGASSWWKEFSDGQPPLEIVCSSVEVAEAVIKDYCVGLLGCDMDGRVPGLFFIPGAITQEEVKKKYRNKLEEVKAKQNNWYMELVKLADALWARMGGNPLVIWDVMRLAAKELNLTDKPWLSDMFVIEKVKCHACGQLKDPHYPVCPVCRAIDPLNPMSKDIKFAG